MANKERGHVTLETGGATYRLSFSMNAMCELEDAFGKPFMEVAELLNVAGLPKISDIRKLLWGAFTDHNPGFEFCDKETLRRVGEIANERGLTETMDLIGEAFQAAFPDPDGEVGKTKASKTTSAG